MKKVPLIILGCLLIAGGILLYIYFDLYRPKHFSVTFLNIGQGDSALIKFENGEKMLVDCGASKIVLSALGRHLPFYDRTIDYVLATHPDLDHYGGCADVLTRYNVKNIIVNGKEKTYDPYWKEWNKVMHEETFHDPTPPVSPPVRGDLRHANVIVMASPTAWTIASSTLEFISPDPALKLDVAAADSNNYSIVFKLTHGNKIILFTGDMELPLENAIMEKYCVTSTPTNTPRPFEGHPPVRGESPTPPWQGGSRGVLAQDCPTLKSTVLKVGHHGSDSGTSEKFLKKVEPSTAVISAGARNRYGHPSLRVIRRLERAGAEILRTDEVGDIVIR